MSEPASDAIPYGARRLFAPYHERTRRFAKIVAHRRFGKTVGSIVETIRAAIDNERTDPPPRYVAAICERNSGSGH